MILIDTCRAAAERLPDFLERKLPADERLALEHHLRGCAGCRARLMQCRDVHSLMQGVLGGSVAKAPQPSESAQFRRVTTGPRLEVRTEEEVVRPEPSYADLLQERMGAAPWWIVSGAFHALLILLLALISMAVMRSPDKEVVIVSSLEKRPEVDPPKPDAVRDVFTNPVPVELNAPVAEPTPVVTHEEVEIADHNETADNSDAGETHGENGISDVMLGGTGTSAAIGVGGGGGGAFGRPTGAGGRLRRAIKGGGGKATESAVDRALEWLARHQEKDGRWDFRKHEGGGKIWTAEGADEGITGLALLAFLGAGHTDRLGKYKDTVRRGLDWVMSKQCADGGWNSKQNRGGQEYEKYDLALCTLALAEAYGMGRNKQYGVAAQRGVDLILSQQDYESGSWNHGPHKSTSLVGWNVMALKSARVTGVRVAPDAFDKALKFLEALTVKDDGRYYGAVRYSPEAAYYAHKGETMTAVGMLCYQFLGKGEKTQEMAKLVAALPPKWMPDGTLNGPPQTSYHWYYGTLAMFQHGGADWKDWNEALKQTLLPNQCVGGPKDGSAQDKDGSWDPVDVWCKIGGRVYQTAMCALCLEVYYRYLPMYR